MVVLVLILNDCCHDVGDLYTWNYGIIVLILNAVAGMRDLYIHGIYSGSCMVALVLMTVVMVWGISTHGIMEL